MRFTNKTSFLKTGVLLLLITLVIAVVTSNHASAATLNAASPPCNGRDQNGISYGYSYPPFPPNTNQANVIVCPYYYANNYPAGWDDLNAFVNGYLQNWPGGETSIYNAQSFENFIAAMLFTRRNDPTSVSLSVGASFLVNEMLGQGKGMYSNNGVGNNDPVRLAQISFFRWATLVNTYERLGLVNWGRTSPNGPATNMLTSCEVDNINPSQCTGVTPPSCLDGTASPSQCSGASDTFLFQAGQYFGANPTNPNYTDEVSFDQVNQEINSDFITFYNPNNPSERLLTIDTSCGNIIGNISPLLIAGDNFNLTPGASAPNLTNNGVTDDENPDRATFTTTLDVNQGSGVNFTDIPPGVTAKVTYHFYIQHPIASGGGQTNIAQFSTTRRWTSNQTWTNSYPISASIGDQVCSEVTVDPAQGQMDNSGTPTVIIVASRSSGTACTTIDAKPFFKVQGSDIVAGSLFNENNGICTNPSSAVASWNKNNSAGANPLFSGAGSAYAGFATGPIDGFATGQNTFTNSGDGLSFANTSNNNPSSGNFGGKFGSAPCATDYWSQKGSTTAIPGNNVNVSSLSGEMLHNGDLTLNGGTFSGQSTLYVNGNLTITAPGLTNGINFGSWNSVSNMPQLTIVVCGNIYIDNSVTSLSGTYVAEPYNSGTSNTICPSTDTAGGTIYTCTNGGNDNMRGTGRWYDSCNSELIVNGSFIANAIQFERSHGTLSTSIPAELFDYSPEEWLAGLNNTNTISNCTPGNDTCYDSITSLPPIL